MVSLFETAIKDDIISKNYASLIELPKGEPLSNRRAFTEDKLSQIRDAAEGGVPYADVVLFMCYTGWRPTEMCLLNKESIDLEKWCIIGGIKTQAGKTVSFPSINLSDLSSLAGSTKAIKHYLPTKMAGLWIKTNGGIDSRRS